MDQPFTMCSTARHRWINPASTTTSKTVKTSWPAPMTTFPPCTMATGITWPKREREIFRRKDGKFGNILYARAR